MIGAFATLVLQIPLESSQPSGRLVLRDGFKEIKTDNLAPNGQSNHNVALLFSSYDCLQVKNYCIQADTGDGVVAAMIFNLICTEYFSLSRYFHIDCYPKLLIIADRIAKALKSRQGIAALSQNQRDGSDEDQSDSYTTISLDSHETSRFFCVPIKNLSSENQFKEFNQYDLGPCGLAVSLIANEIVKFTEATLAFISADIQLSDQELPFDDNGVFSLSDLSLLEEPPIFNFIDPENLPWQVRYVTTNIEDLFTRSISIDQIVETLWCNEYKRSDDLINIPVLVVRSRRSNFKGCKNNFQSSYSEANQSAARLLDEAETFLARHEVELSKNDARPSLVASLLSNLDCVVDILIANSENDTDSSPDYCLEWLSIRALNICTFLKASNQGFAVLDNLAKMSFFETIGLDCACSGHDFPTHTIIASFIRFTCYDQGKLLLCIHHYLL